jgi:drug/metabolite transporter superfamily protein YnfA
MFDLSTTPAQRASLPARLWQYHRERFPLFGHGPLIAVFGFSAIAYSRVCRNAEGFIPGTIYAGGVFMAVSLFLLLRISDEFKDRAEDALYRPHLPVPRGLVSLKELRNLGIVTIVLQILVQGALLPTMFPIYLVVMTWLLLMRLEFFAPAWLKTRPFWYVASHMLIIPLVDVYISGLDWHLSREKPPFGLLFFFLVSYLNGVVLEIGRKIRAAEQEEHNTYSTLLGPSKAVVLWIAILFCTLSAALFASRYAAYSGVYAAVLGVVFLICSAQGVLFLQKKTAVRAKRIEYAAAGWTLAMYLILGSGRIFQ